jgi:hypothetical protein
MKERPILFSAPMVRAILDGSKTQTRRIVKLPHQNPLGQWEPTTVGGDCGGSTADGKTVPLQGAIWHTRTGACLISLYGQPGDRLWVRETFAIVPRTAYRCSEGVQQVLRPDDDHDAAIFREGWTRSRSGFRWRPSIHMPRWASRINLEITGVRVERLQDISEADAIAEGAILHDGRGTGHTGFRHNRDDGFVWAAAKASYMRLWEQINGTGSWEANPWVWVVEFRRLP